MERVVGARAVRGGVRERVDDLQLLDDRARPAVGHDHRQRALVRRPHVEEVDVHAIDAGDELRKLVQACLDGAPIVPVHPALGERLHDLQLHALRGVADDFGLRPAGLADAAVQVVEVRLRELDRERPDRVVLVVRLGPRLSRRHDVLLVNRRECGTFRNPVCRECFWAPPVPGSHSACRRRPTRGSRLLRNRGWGGHRVFWLPWVGVKKSMSRLFTRSASSWWTQWEAFGRRSTRSRLGTSSWWGSARSGPR